MNGNYHHVTAFCDQESDALKAVAFNYITLCYININGSTRSNPLLENQKVIVVTSGGVGMRGTGARCPLLIERNPMELTG